MIHLRAKRRVSSIIPVIFAVLLLANLPGQKRMAVANKISAPAVMNEVEIQAEILSYFPLVLLNSPWRSPFGTESNKPWLSGSNILQKGVELNLKWVRVGGRVSWQKLQPEEGRPIDWTKLAEFESELKELKAAGITPVVIISGSPYWATVQPTSCAAIRRDKFPAFESFIRSLVKRYKVPEYDVHNWELGNEPDVDPRMVPTNSVFGCWGDQKDRYYGGEHYGEMLKVIGPAIKEVDPGATVWFGGLLLASPKTTVPELGRPELFLQGALEAGAAPYFDILPYHWYPGYTNQLVDHDLLGAWAEWGGGTLGKARYLRQLLNQYGVSKPVVLNESNLMCTAKPGCDPPGENFFQMQASHLVRSYVRGLSEGVTGFSAYTLNGPGWRNTGLLDGNGNPRPAYRAYKELIKQLDHTRYQKKITDFEGVEAYAFRSGLQVVEVAWSIDNTLARVRVPEGKFRAAYTRDGVLINPNLVDGFYEIEVGFAPVYVLTISNR